MIFLGLVLPPKIAPYQIVIIPILKQNENDINILNYINDIKLILIKNNIRVKIDNSDYILKLPFNQIYSIPMKVTFATITLILSTIFIIPTL